MDPTLSCKWLNQGYLSEILTICEFSLCASQWTKLTSAHAVPTSWIGQLFCVPVISYGSRFRLRVVTPALISCSPQPPPTKSLHSSPLLLFGSGCRSEPKVAPSCFHLCTWQTPCCMDICLVSCTPFLEAGLQMSFRGILCWTLVHVRGEVGAVAMLYTTNTI